MVARSLRAITNASLTLIDHSIQQLTIQFNSVQLNFNYSSTVYSLYSQHFSRSLLLAPDALGYLLYSDPLTFDKSQYPLLVDILGQGISKIIISDGPREIDYVMLAHKCRSFLALSELIPFSFLRNSADTINHFIENPSVDEGVDSQFSLLGNAVISESNSYDPIALVTTLLSNNYKKALKKIISGKSKVRDEFSVAPSALLPKFFGCETPSDFEAKLKNTENSELPNLDFDFVSRLSMKLESEPGTLSLVNANKLVSFLESWSDAVSSVGGFDGLTKLLDEMFVDNEGSDAAVKKFENFIHSLAERVQNSDTKLGQEKVCVFVSDFLFNYYLACIYFGIQFTFPDSERRI